MFRLFKLSVFQVVSVVSTSFLPLLFWIFPRYAVQFSGIDGQWAVLGVCVLGMVAALIHGLMNHLFGTVSGADMPAKSFGKWIGKAVTLMYIPGYVLFISTSLFSFSLIIKSLLPLTPRLATIVGLSVVAVIGARYGLETIASVASLAFPLIVIILAIATGITMMHASWTGVFFHPVSLERSAYGAIRLFPTFMGINFYLMLNPHYNHCKRNSIWLILLSMGIAIIVLLAVYFTTIAVVGYRGLAMLSHPTEFILQLTQIRGILIERFGIILVFLVTMFQATFFSNHLWALSEIMAKTFHMKPVNQKHFVIPFAIVIVLTLTLIPNQQVGDAIVNDILYPLSWLYIIVIPLLILSAGWMRKVI